MSVAPSASSPLRTELAAGVLTLTLDRSDKRNALNGPLIDALLAALERPQGTLIEIVLDPEVITTRATLSAIREKARQK